MVHIYYGSEPWRRFKDERLAINTSVLYRLSKNVPPQATCTEETTVVPTVVVVRCGGIFVRIVVLTLFEFSCAEGLLLQSPQKPERPRI